jgi:hypothetical protein
MDLQRRSRFSIDPPDTKQVRIVAVFVSLSNETLWPALQGDLGWGAIAHPR